MSKHTFAICAYKESEFLEECIKSLKKQTYKSNIIMATSTPNEYITGLAEKYDIPLYINEGESGIVQDWNFAYAHAETPYVTIAHQDDIYYVDYAERAVKLLESTNKPLIYFTNYAEIRGGKKIEDNNLLKIKRLMLFPMRIRLFAKSKFVRRRILSLGSAICCPSVTLVKDNLPEKVFKVGFRSNEDWEAWEMISRMEGRFLYDHQILMGHRIHEQSETSIILGDGARTEEDYAMFCKFWPKFIAKILTKIYGMSERSNSI